MTLATSRSASTVATIAATTSYTDGAPHHVTLEGGTLMVRNANTGSQSQWALGA